MEGSLSAGHACKLCAPKRGNDIFLSINAGAKTARLSLTRIRVGVDTAASYIVFGECSRACIRYTRKLDNKNLES